MIIYAGSFPIADGSHDAVADALRLAAQQTLAEDGCHAYEFGFDVEDPTRVVFHELYEDREAFDAHMHADHTGALFATLRDHLVGRASGELYTAELVRRDGSS